MVIRGFTFKNNIFMIFVLGVLIPKVADKVYLIAMPWLIYDLTQSAFYMGIMFFMETIPFLVISPLSGVIADRFSFKKILYITTFVQAFGLSLIPVLNYFSILEVWHLYLIGLLLTSASSCFWVVYNTMIPQLFSKKTVIKANLVFQFTETFTIILGASIAGILISLIGIMNIFWINVICFTFSLFLVRALKIKSDNSIENAPEDGNLFYKLKQGFIYVIYHRVLGPLTLLSLIGNIANGVLISMLIYFARDELKLLSHEISYVYIGGAIAQICVIFLIPFLNKRFSAVKLMLVNQFICSIGIIYISFAFGLVGLIIGIAIQSASAVVYNVLNKTFRQIVVPKDMLGRVNGINQMIVRTSFPLAGFIGGILANLMNIRIVFLLLSAITIIFVIRYWFHSFRHYSEETFIKEIKLKKGG